jgi:ankyrin repeat protein
MSACENGHTAIAELLIAKGADTEAKDDVRQRQFEWDECLEGNHAEATVGD